MFIIIKEELIQERKQTTIKNSEGKKEFINKLKVKISKMDTTNILDTIILEYVTQEFATIADHLWNKFSKLTNITRHFKAWWNKECNRDLATY